MPDVVRTKKHQGEQVIMRDTQAKEAHNGHPVAEGDVTVEVKDEQTMVKKFWCAEK